MRIKLLGISAIIGIVLLINACAKRTFEVEIKQHNIDSLNITASLKGRVTDETGMPIANALVACGISSTTTNVNGEFSFRNILMNDYAAYVTVNKNGYFTGSRTFMARSNQLHFTEIQLLKKSEIGQYDSKSSMNISLANGASITIPANALVDANTFTAYTGVVHAFIAYIDAANTNTIGKQINGNFRGTKGINITNEKWMQDLSLMNIELYGDKGNLLQLANSINAVIKFPVPSALTSIAPTTCEMWSYGQSLANTGFWLNSGATATLSGNYYVASVPVIATWACATSYTGMVVSGTIKDANNNYYINQPIRVKRVYSNTYSYAYTDTLGYFQTLSPANEPLVIEALNFSACNPQQFSTFNVGPFDSGTNHYVGVLIANTMPSYGVANVAGKLLNCNAQPVASGVINFRFKGIAYQATVTNGSYKIDIPMCVSVDTISFYAVDNSNQYISKWANAIIYTGTTNAMSDFAVCNDTLNTFLAYAVDSFKIDTMRSPLDTFSGVKVTNVATPFTTIMAANAAKTNKLLFSFEGTGVGQYNVTTLNITNPHLPDSAYKNHNNNLGVNITEYGNVGGFIKGSFYGLIKGYPSKNVDTLKFGSFKVRRDY